ncbi:HAD family hydrolase [Cognatishimia sp. F0-27]|uniref:HAD family hydrolase n=1 Tax=Cognatishimia sp. F0-27 TaxID=2816855 RepID=UPI001D0C9B18|nr:HAD family hydrolase [Cognatishimia sp. F0-27]MCC1493215.1 HAD family hydrolase [Cognatishimia sp. F0-27]
MSRPHAASHTPCDARSPRPSLAPHDAIIFDLDGTLIDRAPCLHRAASRMLREFGGLAPDLATFRTLIGGGHQGLVRSSLANAGLNQIDSDAALERFRNHIPAGLSQRAEVFGGVAAMIDTLKRRGIRVGLTTKKPRRAAHRLLDAMGLSGFDCIVTAEDVDAPMPNAALLAIACAALATVPERAIFVGDSTTDAHLAAALPIRFVHVCPAGRSPRLAVAPVVTVQSPADLLKVLI